MAMPANAIATSTMVISTSFILKVTKLCPLLIDEAVLYDECSGAGKVPQ
jgi:hypothetical protein